ncbi:MAG: UDP-N-acetylmuramate dehydrogenase [Balneolaceae bacterium]
MSGTGKGSVPEIRKGIDLTPWNTMSVKAVAERFTSVQNSEQLLALHRKGELRIGDLFVLGGGSNVLFAGRVDPLVLKVEIGGLEQIELENGAVHLRAGAGVNWHSLVTHAVRRGLGGIENLALIPGTAGAAPIQNIGAYGVELDDRFVSLEALDLESGSMCRFERSDCRFGYRDSLFKRSGRGRYVVTSITLRLDREPHIIRRGYRALDDWLQEQKLENPGIEDIYDAVVAIRSSKLPDPKELGNAGSFFKNPILSEADWSELKAHYEDVPGWPAGEGQIKVPAGWLIEKAGWKGRREGSVGTYNKQALVVVNHGGATGEEVLQFASRIQNHVREKFAIDLVPEVNIIGSMAGQSELKTS